MRAMIDSCCDVLNIEADITDDVLAHETSEVRQYGYDMRSIVGTLIYYHAHESGFPRFKSDIAETLDLDGLSDRAINIARHLDLHLKPVRLEDIYEYKISEKYEDPELVERVGGKIAEVDDEVFYGRTPRVCLATCVYLVSYRSQAEVADDFGITVHGVRKCRQAIEESQ